MRVPHIFQRKNNWQSIQNMKNFKLWDNLIGWLTFIVAAVTYLLTIEPTASFWDCGEFISTAYKLDVGHPPGAPFFMLTGRFFSLFASDPTKVAAMINSMSALCSAFTILFLFWTITLLARKMFVTEGKEISLGTGIGILGAGLVGSLAYTFSDTFWFSAVEGEVYAYSSLFTAVVFWLILKWDAASDKAGSDRWLILIAYLMGLSIGVHLLNLLAIPAIVLVYYFNKFKPTLLGFCIAMVTSAAILGVVLYGLIPGFVEVACWFELFFVNILGCSYNTGVFIYIIIVIASLVWAIWETHTGRNYWRMAISFILAVTAVGIPFFGESVIIGLLVIAALAGFFYWKKDIISSRWLNTAILMIAVMLIGYSSYTLIVVRSAAQPPMDQNSPDNVFALKYYLNREQYGDRPLFFGPTYNAPVKLRVEGNMCIPVEKVGAAQYAPKPKSSPDEKDEYIITGHKTTYKMDDRFNMLFPRLYSTQPSHIDAYKSWAEIKGKKVTYDYCGQMKSEMKPTFLENLRFFVRYQCNFMYWRYFMWNFSGRQNDIQSHGEIDHGNWITGIPFIDNARLGDQSTMPDELKNNKGHNKYYMLPLLLGIIGIIFQLTKGEKGKQNFVITFLLFFLTGLAIVIYLNQTPYQPRERDYAYAGSFYAYCIWIGLGVLGLLKIAEKYIPKPLAAAILTVLCLGVPVLMAAENWDDHDRSNRYVARDFGGNYLASCGPNAIIFCNGDNDTFPLWYNQEVEGYRTDVRSCNLSYLQTDWYIGQMKRSYYESAGLPITWEEPDFISGTNEVVWVEDRMKQPADLKMIFDFIRSDNPQTKLRGEPYFPTNQVYIPIDKEKVLNSPAFANPVMTDSTPLASMGIDTMRCRYTPDEIAPQIDINLKRRATKSEMMVMEMLLSNEWQRPVYFAVTVGNDYYLGLEKYFELVGMAYQVTPKASEDGQPRTNTEIMYDNMMNKFRYGNVSAERIYLDENTLRMCRTHRLMFAQLVEALINEGKDEKALAALDYCMEVLPGRNVPHDYTSANLAAAYYHLGEFEKGNEIMDDVANKCVQYINWGLSLRPAFRKSLSNRIGNQMAIFNYIMQTCNAFEQDEIVNKYKADYENIVASMSIR